jgi:hypothetical protein
MITTGPVNDLQPWQAEFNGLLIGAGTDFGFPQALDLLALHTVRNMDYSRIWSDGDYSGPDFTDVTTPDLPIEVYATSPDQFFQDVMAFMGAFGPQTGDLPLWIRLPGMPVMGVPARVNSRTLPADYSWGTFAQGSVQFRLLNATWQSVPTVLTLTGNTNALSGLVAPLGTYALASSGTYAPPGVLDAGLTSTVPSAGQVTNTGNSDCWPVVLIQGPCRGFEIDVAGEAVISTDTISAQQTAQLDYGSGTYTLNGSYRNTFLTSRNWEPVPAGGVVPVRFIADGGTATVYTADIWR